VVEHSTADPEIEGSNLAITMKRWREKSLIIYAPESAPRQLVENHFADTIFDRQNVRSNAVFRHSSNSLLDRKSLFIRRGSTKCLSVKLFSTKRRGTSVSLIFPTEFAMMRLNNQSREELKNVFQTEKWKK